MEFFGAFIEHRDLMEEQQIISDEKGYVERDVFYDFGRECLDGSYNL